MRMRLATLCVVSLAISLTVESALAEPEGAQEPLDIGSRLELFVDDYLIESMDGVRLKLHEPYSAGKVLTFDRPWEGTTCFYVTVFQDGQRYRMYYRGSSDPETSPPSALKPGEVSIPKHPPVICYAESLDGIHWKRPSLGLHEFNGSRENNIVWMDQPGAQRVTDCMYVFKDGNPAAPNSQRYKAVGGSSPPLVALVSADGLGWQEFQGQKSLISEGLHSNAFDALSVVFWDSVRTRYVIFFRDMSGGPEDPTVKNYGNRSFKYATSEDFTHWTYPRWVDFGGAPYEHLYTNGTTPYFRAPHIYLAFPKRFLPWRSSFPDAPRPGLSEGVFMSSRDGLHWDRRFLEAFIQPGRDPRNWLNRNNLPSAGLVSTSADEISLYVVRNYKFPSVHLERMVLRMDGFVSVHAGHAGGEFVTKPLVFQGDKLVLNFATSAAGSIRLEIQDAQGNPLPGFALEESPLIWGDEVEHTVRWERTHAKATSDKPLARIAGKPVRLRFVMKDADLYSLRFR